jgi:hypothetical protein
LSIFHFFPDQSTSKLVVVGTEEEKEKRKKAKVVHFTPLPRRRSHLIVTKIGQVGGMERVIKRAKIGVDRMIGVGSAGS